MRRLVTATVGAVPHWSPSPHPPGTVDTLLKPENKDQLVKVLAYHVVPGRITAPTSPPSR